MLRTGRAGRARSVAADQTDSLQRSASPIRIGHSVCPTRSEDRDITNAYPNRLYIACGFVIRDQSSKAEFQLLCNSSELAMQYPCPREMIFAKKNKNPLKIDFRDTETSPYGVHRCIQNSTWWSAQWTLLTNLIVKCISIAGSGTCAITVSTSRSRILVDPGLLPHCWGSGQFRAKHPNDTRLWWHRFESWIGHYSTGKVRHNGSNKCSNRSGCYSTWSLATHSQMEELMLTSDKKLLCAAAPRWHSSRQRPPSPTFESLLCTMFELVSQLEVRSSSIPQVHVELQKGDDSGTDQTKEPDSTT